VTDRKPWHAIFRLLELEPAAATAAGFGEVGLGGRMGDRTGTVSYQAVSAEPLDRWRETMANPLRKRWCAAYLRRVGGERLRAMGYDPDELARAVDGLGTGPRGVVSDAARRLDGLRRSRRSARLLGTGARRAAPAPPATEAAPR
jgi:hypothetical protein